LKRALPRFFAAYPDLELLMSEGDRFVDFVLAGIARSPDLGPHSS
jgi:hypothetical protein